MLFDVRVIAFEPHGSEDPVEALVRVFKVERAVATELVHRLPRVIKRSVPMETAQRFQEVLRKLGARTEIVVSPPHRGDAAEPTERALSQAKANKPSAALARARASGSRNGQGLPAPNPAVLAPALAQAPANGNAARLARAATSQSAAIAADPAGLVLPSVSRASASRPAHRAAPHGDAARGRYTLPEPREPEPMARTSLPPRAAAGHAQAANLRAARHPSAMGPGEAEDSRIQRAQLGRISMPNAVARSTPGDAVLPDATIVDPPAQLRAPVDAERKSDRASFRPARPAPDLSASAPAPTPAAAPAATPSQPAHGAAARSSLVAQTPSFGAPFALPPLAVSGPSMNAKDCEQPGTGGLLTKTWIATSLMFVALTLTTFGVLPVLLLALLVRDAWKRWSVVRAFKASTIPVSQAQLPELYACIKQFALRLELTRVPKLYVAGSTRSGTLAVPFRGELYLLIDGEVMARQLERGTSYAISFVLAHELARYALGHHNRGRAFLAAIWPMLRKADVLSADAVAVQLMVDPRLAQRALLVLLSGPGLAGALDLSELARQTSSHERDATAFAGEFDGGSGFILARLHHMRRGYKDELPGAS